jgi:hypothetical protein
MSRTESIHRLGTIWSLADLMRQIHGSGLFLIAQIIGDIEESCKGRTGLAKDDTAIIQMFSTLQVQLQNSDLKVSLNIVKTANTLLTHPNSVMDFEYARGQALALKEAAYAELRTLLFFRMDEEFRAHFENPNIFGEPVALKFPAASFDIEEGGKCLSLARPTASVFHMMRVMEVGLKALAKDLKIPYAPSWESYIKQIDANITAKHKSKSKAWKAIEPFYRDVLGNLMAIKIAWRNPTMHIVRNYTSTEAEDVLRAVRTLMQRLSEKLSQV